MAGKDTDDIREAGEDADNIGKAEKELKKTQTLLNDANEVIDKPEKFHEQLKNYWGQEASILSAITFTLQLSVSMFIQKALLKTILFLSLRGLGSRHWGQGDIYPISTWWAHSGF
jgi:hypothetical protein